MPALASLVLLMTLLLVAAAASSFAPIHVAPVKTWSVAPMMAHTHQHFRAFCRMLSPETAQLFTEMITCDEVIKAADVEKERDSSSYQLDRLLAYSSQYENADSLILQLGGRDPARLARACAIAAGHPRHPYQRFNLNSGCPSNTIASVNQYGCALMLEPELTAECCREMGREGEVSVKCRIGLDTREEYEHLHDFISTVSSQGGVRYFQIHARKALMGSTPMSNRQVPPLRYDLVHAVARDFPALRIELNGGLTSTGACMDQLSAEPALSGVMVGRAVVNHPYAFSGMDLLLGRINGQPSLRAQATRGALLAEYSSYLSSLPPPSSKLAPSSVTQMLSPVFNLFAGEPGCERFQRKMSTMVKRGVSSPAFILALASKEIPTEILTGTTSSRDDAQDLVRDLPWVDKRKKTTALMKANIL